jgi:cytidine deaminase
MTSAERRVVTEDEWRRLTDAAQAARANAYAPYSEFHVGAAVLADDRTIYSGCNVENASYGLTVCAERTAVASAVAQGHRHFRALAVISPNGVSPCGACRQVLIEFAPDMPVRLISAEGRVTETTTSALLPDCFTKGDLE